MTASCAIWTNLKLSQSDLTVSFLLAARRRLSPPSRGFLKHLPLMARVADAPTTPPQAIDHKNRDGLDNRRENLRFATAQQNACNLTKRQGTTSKYKGVYWYNRTSQWVAIPRLMP